MERYLDDINWATIDEKTFNDLVEALLVMEYTAGGLVAQAIDGRGGDGGIDVDVRARKTWQIVNIFQLKYFPGGMSGGHVKRRDQVRESLNRALEEEKPPVWTLVTMTKVTARERKAVRGMRSGRVVRIDFVGPPELDGLLGRHPEIYERFFGDRTARALQAIGRPEAALKKPDDLAHELGRLRAVADARSQHWGYAFGVDALGAVTQTLFAKRSDAAEREPLGIQLDASFGPDDRELADKFASLLDYGSGKEIVLPGHVVSELRQVGPEWFEKTLKPAEVRITRSQEETKAPSTLTLFDARGELVHSANSVATTVSRGVIGWSLQQTVSEALQLEWRVPDDHAQPGELTLELDSIGVSAREVRRAARFLDALGTAHSLELAVGSQTVTKVELVDGELTPLEPEFKEFVQDLCELELQLDTTIVLPSDEVSLRDRKWARVAVLLLRGEATPHPYAEAYTGTLTGEDAPGLRELLGGNGILLIQDSRWRVELFGTTLELGRINTFGYAVEVDDGPEIGSALDRGEAEGMKIRVVPPGGQPFVMYRPASMAADASIVPHPWGLEGVSEHPGLKQLPSSFDTQRTI